MHPAAGNDFVICRNAPYGQMLVLPSRRLVRPVADDDFVISHYPPKFTGHRDLGRVDITILLCHEIFQDFLIKGHVSL